MKRIYLALVSIVLVALLGLASCVGTQPGAPTAPTPTPQQQQGGMTGSGGMMGGQGEMMGGQGGIMGQGGTTPPQGTSGTPVPYQQPYPYGPGGMMGPGMMGGMMGPGMMGGPGNYGPQATPLTLEQAADAVHRYLNAYGKGLSLTEVMEFDRNFYAEVEEEDTGIHAMELLIDKYSGRVYPEMGPNMVWNTKYGMMSQMMGSYYAGGVPTATMPVTPQQAQALAQQFLDAYRPGLTVGDADTFYGYYTLHTLKDGQVEGMLSVNGFAGAVWYHDWHGPFVGMAEFGEETAH